MTSEQKGFALVGKHMRRRSGDPGIWMADGEMPAIADLIRRIDRALTERRAA